jgi:hypothetical protein
MSESQAEPTPDRSKAMGLELTVLARAPVTILDRAEKYGLDRSVLEDAAGLVETDLANPDARVAKVKVIALWRAIAERAEDPLFGLKLGASLRARELGLVGYVMAASETVRGAMESLSRYGRILADDLQCVLRAREEFIDYELEAGVDLIANIRCWPAWRGSWRWPEISPGRI